MDYGKLYENFIRYCKNVDIEQRIKVRDPYDFRLGKSYIYKENHHILPKHDGGMDEPCNLVLLTTEEHLFAHKIRWKAYKQRGDMLAVRFTLNGVVGERNEGLSEVKMNLTKKVFQGIKFISQNSSEVRKTHGWHTEDGAKRISEARKGTMPVRDLNGNMIGSVRTNHPKVISGEWVHHTKGRKISSEERLLKSLPGTLNPNFNEILTKERILGFINENYSKIVDENHLIKKKLENELKMYMEQYNKKVSTVVVCNRFGSIQNLVEEYNEKYDSCVMYEPYFRSSEIKQQISSSLLRFNEKEEKQ